MTVLITGGAGFIGVNVARSLLASGEKVRILDNLSRGGSPMNLRWLSTQRNHARLDVVVADIRDRAAVMQAVAGVTHVYHFAAQVSAASSIYDPRLDFDVNAGGTINLLEAIRAQPRAPSLVFTSTNKVYGQLDGIPLKRTASRYTPRDGAFVGISESTPLSLRNPYGCSAGTADQYVLDYAATYGVAAVVLRLSCIYGPRQFGCEECGWVAHFISRALHDQSIRILGDGQQVRDVLYIDDLVDALERARFAVGRLAGRAFNVGGGPKNTLSVFELVERVAELNGRAPALVFKPWRLADQRWYVSDIRAFSGATAWVPTVDTREGIERMHHWVQRRPVDTTPQSLIALS